MINAEKHGKNFLNALFNTSKKTSGNTISFSLTPYIALFTTMPDENGSNYKEPTSSEYARVLLTNTGAYGKQMIGVATTEDGTGKNEGKKVAKVTNQDLITFPEARSVGFGEIVGFGIFETATTGVGACMLWGKLGSYSDDTDEFIEETVNIAANEIPIFRIGDFEIIFS